MQRSKLTKGTYIYPVDKADIQRISYSESPAHVGPLKYSIDFIVPEGTPVKAMASGRVVDLKADGIIGGDSRKFEKHGNFVEIYHPKYEEYSQVEHLSVVLVEPGQEVRQGQVVGLSGSTGYRGGLPPHVHASIGTYGEYQTLKIRLRR